MREVSKGSGEAGESTASWLLLLLGTAGSPVTLTGAAAEVVVPKTLLDCIAGRLTTKGSASAVVLCAVASTRKRAAAELLTPG